MGITTRRSEITDYLETKDNDFHSQSKPKRLFVHSATEQDKSKHRERHLFSQELGQIINVTLKEITFFLVGASKQNATTSQELS